MKRILLLIAFAVFSNISAFADTRVIFSTEYCIDLAAWAGAAAKQATKKTPWNQIVQAVNNTNFADINVKKAVLHLAKEAYEAYSNFPTSMTDTMAMEISKQIFQQCLNTKKPGVVTYDLPDDWDRAPKLPGTTTF